MKTETQKDINRIVLEDAEVIDQALKEGVRGRHAPAQESWPTGCRRARRKD
jgi:hypothetical protein